MVSHWIDAEKDDRGLEGNHTEGKLHPVGQAIDLQSN